MRQLQSVLWSKGVLLSPQHLQTQDRFLEGLIGFQLGSLTFCPWGFSRLEVDREALVGGVVKLNAASGIFPDGLLFDVPEPDTGPESKALEGHWIPDQETLTVSLAIPEYQFGDRNISSPEHVARTRYVSRMIHRRDENDGSAEKPIQVAGKNFLLVTESESSHGLSTMPAVRVRRSSTGEVELDARFVPPLLDIAASEHLIAIARRLVEILRTRSSSLSGMRRRRNKGLADFGVSDVATFWLLYTVNAYLPELRHLLETRRGHPSRLYASMLGLAGALTTFSSSIAPGDLPGYDHGDLTDSFNRLDAQVRELLETVVPTNWDSIELVEGEASLYSAPIESERYLSAPQVYLAIRTDVGAADLLQNIHLLKISSSDQVKTLTHQALPGVRLAHVPNPPNAIPVKSDYEYFTLERSGPHWDAIRVGRRLAAHVPGELPNPKMELVFILPAEE